MKMQCKNEVIAKAESIIENEQVANINMSTIFTKLIQEAGKCESYASDVLYDIQNIATDLNDISSWRHKEYWFGFRDMGIDGLTFITSRGLYSKEYRKVWRLDIDKFDSISPFDLLGKKITVILTEVR